MINKLLYTVLLFVSSVTVFGQGNTNKALDYYQKQNWDSAKYFIDLSLKDEASRKVPNNWYYAGFIYKELYNNTDERNNKTSLIRETAIEYLFTYLEKDSTLKMGESVRKSLKYLITTVYNDAVTSINPKEYKLAIELFTSYKGKIKSLEPEVDLRSVDIQFNQVLAQVYNHHYENDRKTNSNYFGKVISAYNYILSLEPNNLSANYNMGILYYNEAVHRIKEMDYEEDLITIALMQDTTVELFRKALPFMSKAYELNPKRAETLHGLSGIYFSLNIPDLSQRYKQELELLEKEKSETIKKKLSDTEYLFSVYLKVDEINTEFGLKLPLDYPELIDLVKGFNPSLSSDPFDVENYIVQIVKRSTEGLPQEISVNVNKK